MTRGVGMQEVELLDADAPTDAVRARLSRRQRRPIVVGSVVLALALAATQGVAAAQERAAVARLSAMPGVLAPVDATLTVTRRVPADDTDQLVGNAGGLHVDDDGAQSYTWVGDAADDPGWTVEVLGATPALADNAGHVIASTSCLPDEEPGGRPGRSSRVVCLVTDGGLIVDGGGGIARVPSTVRRVVVLSAADGSVVARWPVDRGDSMALLPGLVVLGSGSAHDSTVTAHDVLTGEQRWTHVDRVADGLGYSGGDVVNVSVFRTGDLIAYSPPSRSLLLLAADGTVVRNLADEARGDSWGWSTDPRHGSLVLHSQDGAGATRSTFLAPDGDPAADVTVDGRPVELSVDDGSVPGLLLTANSELRAWDAGTGTARWSHEGSAVTGALVVRGRVYVASSLGVVALDGRSGRTLWASATEDGPVVGPPLTDGRHVLVPFANAEPVLVAYDPVSGREEFRTGYPAGVAEVGPAGRLLVGRDSRTGDAVVLG
ncbi:MAG: PQQ-binding-like beta-propeller repeat protein [Cellulomonas sp.]